MGRQTFKYILLCIAFYIALSAIEIFGIKPIINYFTNPGFWNYMIIYNVLLLLVNPVIVYFIINKFFNFKSDEVIIEEPIIEKHTIEKQTRVARNKASND